MRCLDNNQLEVIDLFPKKNIQKSKKQVYIYRTVHLESKIIIVYRSFSWSFVFYKCIFYHKRLTINFYFSNRFQLKSRFKTGYFERL